MTTYRKTMTEMYQQVRERTLTPTELKRREEIAKDLPLKDFEKIILEKNRSNAGFSAPAHGLFLTDINYDWDKIK